MRATHFHNFRYICPFRYLFKVLKIYIIVYIPSTYINNIFYIKKQTKKTEREIMIILLYERLVPEIRLYKPVTQCVLYSSIS